MAAETIYWVAGGTGAWSGANNWASSSGGAGGSSGHVPGAENGSGDTVIFDSSSGAGTATVDANVPSGDTALAELDMDFGGSSFVGTLAFGTYTIDVDGDCLLAGTLTASAGATLEVSGYFAKIPGMTDLPALLDIELNGTGFVETNDIGGGTVTVNTAGTHTQIDKALWDEFTLTIGTYRGKSSSPGHGMDVAGNIVRTAGTWQYSGTVEQTVSGDVAHNDGATPLEHIKLGSTGVTSNMTSHVYATEITVGLGYEGAAITGATVDLHCQPSANDKWHQTSASGTIACRYIVMRLNGNVNVGYVYAGDTGSGLKVTQMVTSYTATMTDEWSAGTKVLAVAAASAGECAKLDCDGNPLTCGAIQLGASAGTQSGQIDFGEGIIDMASLTVGHDGNSQNAIAFASAYVKLSGTFDGNQGGTNPPTNTNTKATVVGGLVTELDLTGQAVLQHLWPSSGGANITNVTEISPLLHQVLGEVYVT